MKTILQFWSYLLRSTFLNSNYWCINIIIFLFQNFPKWLSETYTQARRLKLHGKQLEFSDSWYWKCIAYFALQVFPQVGITSEGGSPIFWKEQTDMVLRWNIKISQLAWSLCHSSSSTHLVHRTLQHWWQECWVLLSTGRITSSSLTRWLSSPSKDGLWCWLMTRLSCENWLNCFITIEIDFIISCLCFWFRPGNETTFV